MLLVPASAILISPRARCLWQYGVDEMADHLGHALDSLGPLMAEIQADGTAVLYRVGDGGVTVSIELDEEDWRPRWLA